MSRIFSLSDAVYKSTYKLFAEKSAEEKNQLTQNVTITCLYAERDHAPALQVFLYIFRTSLKELSNMPFALHEC